MKFRKISVIGAIFTLALALAATMAFASESKASACAAACHGRAFNCAAADQMLADVKGMLRQGRIGFPVCTDADCPAIGLHHHKGGETVYYCAALSGACCTRADCGNTGVHTHDGVTYQGWMCPAPSAAPEPSPASTPAPAAAPESADPNALPLAAGSWSVCPVEGCTTPGNHTHDGVTVYACNGAHCGGVCDGSCLVQFGNGAVSAPAASVQSGSGCHSGSHHSSGHHRGGHH